MRAKLCVLAALGVLAAILVPAAFANSTMITHYPDGIFGPSPMTDICPSSVDFSASTWGVTQTQFFDNTGNRIATHWSWFEQDTWSGPTGTLVGEPFSIHQFVTYDSEGNLVTAYDNGLIEKVRLPDGSLFISVGRTNYIGLGFIWVPDVGHFGDLNAFCAALGA